MKTPQPPLAERVTAIRWLSRNLLYSPLSTAVTLILLAVIAKSIVPLFEWAIVDAVWRAGDPEACVEATGACWAVVAEKYRPMLFGVYPYSEHWRLAIAVVIFLATVGISCAPRFWSFRLLAPLWLACLISTGTLLWGGVFGLTAVATDQWGGLPLTLVLFSGTIVFGFPIAILLALGRCSDLPAVRVMATTFIECTRGVPLITILFVVVNVLPLFFSEGVELNKMLRVMAGLALFSACYQAEVIRGGLQAIPPSQYEAAESLGLNYRQTMTRVIVPQALRICLPGLVNHVIAAFKNTSFVIVIGMFDMLTATSAVLNDPLWRRYYVEAYFFIAAVYFGFCYALSKYSQWLEAWLARGRGYAGEET